MHKPHYTEAEVAAALGGPVKHLGVGAFGETYRREDTAVKIIVDPGYSPARLRREVDGLRRVSSPYVVRLIETRTLTLRGKQRESLVFEYIEGGDVASQLASGRLPSTGEAVEFLRRLLTGVGDMHACRTVHRDIKPANIALRGGDWSRPVLLDLGLARGAGEATITAYPQPVGTFAYMAPEQLQGQSAGQASDLFSVGVTVREALAGQHPFYGPGPYPVPEEMAAVIAAGPCPLPPDVPAAVAELLDRLTAELSSDRGSSRSSLKRLGAAGVAA